MGRKTIDRTGEKGINNQGLEMIILNYRSSNDIDVIFLDGFIFNGATYKSFKKGSIRNRNWVNKKTKDKNKVYNYHTLDNRVGETKIMNCGLRATIINYNNANDIDVEFENGFISKNKTYRRFTEGKIGIKERDVVINYICRKYWNGVIKRSFSESFKNDHPTYKDVSVCDEWLCYNNFEKWFSENYYEVKGERMELDKDILVKGNKIYSPDTCIFVPAYINLNFRGKSKKSGLPKGIQKNGKRYSVSLNCKYIGTFETPEKAFQVYKEAKEQYIKQVADEYKDRIPQKLYEAMYRYEVEITD